MCGRLGLRARQHPAWTRRGHYSTSGHENPAIAHCHSLTRARVNEQGQCFLNFNALLLGIHYRGGICETTVSQLLYWLEPPLSSATTVTPTAALVMNLFSSRDLVVHNRRTADVHTKARYRLRVCPLLPPALHVLERPSSPGKRSLPLEQNFSEGENNFTKGRVAWG